ncbi:MAG: POTRA domain-containing protein [Chthoniobacter sp.]
MLSTNSTGRASDALTGIVGKGAGLIGAVVPTVLAAVFVALSFRETALGRSGADQARARGDCVRAVRIRRRLPPSTPPAPARPGAGPLYIGEYRVVGSQLLKEEEIGEAVYPFLGPGRREGDVLGAAAALERVYKEKGYQTVSVTVPAQTGRGGVVFLQVTEAKVGRLRVKGSRWFSLAEIKKKAPSLGRGGRCRISTR